MDMFFCRGCGKEIHESAPICPHCGAPQGKSLGMPFASYDQVPWYRKNWFAILSFFILVPALLISLLTGDIYYERKGQLKRYSMVAKIFLIIWCLAYTGQAVNQIIRGSESSDVKMVKGGVLESCPNHTVEQMVNNFMDSPVWESGKSDDDKKYVNVMGGITYADKPVRATIQFTIQGNNFLFHAFEMNGVPSAELIAAALMEKMCFSAKGSVERQTATKAPEITPPAMSATDSTLLDTSNPPASTASEALPIVEKPEETAPTDQPPKNISEKTQQQASTCTILLDCISFMLNGANPRRPDVIQGAATRISAMMKPHNGDRKTAQALKTQGLNELENGNYAGAIKFFGEAHQADPGNAEISANFGYAYVKAGDSQSAIQALQEALLLDPRRTNTWIAFAEASDLSGNVESTDKALLLAYEFSGNKNKTAQFLKNKGADTERPSMRDAYIRVSQIVDAGY